MDLVSEYMVYQCKFCHYKIEYNHKIIMNVEGKHTTLIQTFCDGMKYKNKIISSTDKETYN